MPATCCVCKERVDQPSHKCCVRAELAASRVQEACTEAGRVAALKRAERAERRAGRYRSLVMKLMCELKHR